MSNTLGSNQTDVRGSDNLVDSTAADLVIAELVTTAGLADPYARLERLRAMGRAVPSTLGVVLTGYDDCQAALRNSALMSSPDAAFGPLVGDEWRENRAFSLLGESLLFLEGHQHNRLRKLVASAFTPAAVASWQPTIQSIVDDLLADVTAALIRNESVDLIARLARLVPIAVMADLLGLPRADAAELQVLVAEVANLTVGLGLDDDTLSRAHVVGTELDSYLRNALRMEEGSTKAGLLGRIALDQSASEFTITEDDRVSLAFILLAAGFETTSMLVGNCFHHLLQSSTEWDQLASNPDRASIVIEETLRLETPAAFVSRFVSTPTSVGGSSVDPGGTVSMFLAAANRDPLVYADPGRFVPSRYAAQSPALPPLSFGSGMHHCLGSILAREEARAVFRRLATLGDHARIEVVGPPQWRPSIALRGIDSLIIRRRVAFAPLSPVPNSKANAGITATNVIVDAKARRRKTSGLAAGLVGGWVKSRAKATFVGKEKGRQIKEDFAAQGAARAAAVMGDLKGVTMKTGQMASFLAPTMSDAAKRSLAALQSSAPPMEPGEAEAAIERQFGRSISQLFTEWNTTPVAAASIGQVHRARLHDGREVAVKVQYPGIRDALAADLKDQAKMTKLIQRFAMRNIDADMLSRDITSKITEEIDYTNEADHQREFATRYRGHPFIGVPRVIDELSTATVLTSEWVEGQKWQTFVDRATQPQKDVAGEILGRFMFSSTRRYRHFNSDPNPGNFIVAANGERITFIDFGLCTKVTPEQDIKMWLLHDSITDGDDAATMDRRSIETGYLKPGHGIEPDLLYRYFRTSVEFYEGDFTVTPDWFSQTMRHLFLFEGGFTSIRSKLSTEAEYFLRDRIHWGVLGLLAELKATADWGSMSRQYRFGREPRSELGRIEAAWDEERRPQHQGTAS